MKSILAISFVAVLGVGASIAYAARDPMNGNYDVIYVTKDGTMVEQARVHTSDRFNYKVATPHAPAYYMDSVSEGQKALENPIEQSADTHQWVLFHW